jgi:hypothetical protein
LDLQKKMTYSAAYSGLFRIIVKFLLFLMIATSFLIPSSLYAITQSDLLKQDSALLSSVDQDKSEYFQSQLDKYIGVPYTRGGTTEKGFDCSGFVRQVYQEFFGLDLPHQSSSQSSLPFMQKIAKDELVTGDLIFFSTTGKKKRINHVGIYLSDGRFIHAAKGGVTVSSLDNNYWKARFFVAKRVGNNDIWDKLEVEGKTESGLLEMYNKYSSRFSLLADLNGNSSNFDTFPYYSDYSKDTLSLGYEITWSTSIANGSIVPKVTAFQEYYRPFQSNINDSTSSFRNTEFGLMTASDRLSDQGMHLTAAFRGEDSPLSLTPSFAYVDSGYDYEKRHMQRFTYGLDLEISPVNKPWLLALGMQYSEYSYLDNTSSSGTLNEFRSPLNMSFTYLHQLSKSSYLSLIGEVVQQYEPASKGGSLDQWKDERRSMFLFNYNY